MPSRRPGAVTVMAILNIVFGSLQLLTYLCCGILLLVVFNNQSIFAVAGVNIFADQWEFMARDLPSYPAVRIASVTLALILNTTLLVSGIGLLNLRVWAWLLALGYGIVTIVVDVAWVGYTAALTIPAKRRWAEDFQRRLNLPPTGGGGVNDEVIGILIAFLEVVYAIILLTMMLKRNVRAAFGGHSLEDHEGPDRYDPRDEDYYGGGGDRNPWGY